MLKFACAAVLAVSIVANAQATPLRPTPAYVATTMKTTINHRAAFAGTPGLVKSITCTELATRRQRAEMALRGHVQERDRRAHDDLPGRRQAHLGRQLSGDAIRPRKGPTRLWSWWLRHPQPPERPG